jgi:protein-tyrosine kinase
MLIPKASHLVERVTERLKRSGALDQSAVHMMPEPGGQAVPDTVAQDERWQDVASPGQPPSASPAMGVPGHQSSLFTPAPAAARFAGTPANPAMARPLVAPATECSVQPNRPGSEATANAPDAPDQRDPDAAGLPSPAIATWQPGAFPAAAGQSATFNRLADGTTIVPPAGDTPFGQRGAYGDPAAGTLQGPVTIDAIALERAGMVDWSRTRTRISEEFRLVQRQILRSAFGPGAEPGFSNLLLVTSARPGEGKSFMSTNLSGSIARQGDHHVLLVDADSKRDSICYNLGLAQARGLLDLAANPKLDPSPLIVKTPIERLSILPVGRERERSAELFSTKEMTRLIQSLGRRYADRLLILDAPPCLSTSDPAVLAQVVGQILFVVEADRTQRDEIEASLDLIQACPTITLVLNKQQISSRYTFGAYSSYYSS